MISSVKFDIILVTMTERPSAKTLTVLKGKVKEPQKVISRKRGPEGKKVSVSLVKEGAGMVGLEDAADNQEWSGIFNHFMKVARVATFLGKKLKEKGEQVNLDLLLNTILVSHCGRRQWDEARWYPQAVADAQTKIEKGDSKIALELLVQAEIDPAIIEVVEAHGVGGDYLIEAMDAWEKKLAMYADFRVSQKTMSLQERFDDLRKRAIPAGRISEQQLAAIEAWAFETETEIFSKIDLKPEEITDKFPPSPRWERYLRRLYLHDAEEGIFRKLSKLYEELKAGTINPDQLDLEFPPNTWWGEYARKLYKAQEGHPYQPKPWKARGIQRAIEFYQKLGKKRK